MKAILISDLHLQASRPDITERFQRFCEEKLQDIDHFFILGDFFEVWIGDDYQDDFIASIKNTLKGISARVKHCYFQHGNRDFLVGEQFCQESGFQLLEDEHGFTINNKRFLLIHGDTLCTRDTEYMQARQLFRNPDFQQQVLSKTIDERLALAQQLRAASKEASSGKAMDIMDVTPEEVVKLMEANQVDTLIHGHTHRPAVHELSLQHNAKAKRMVMSDWENEVRYIRIDDNGDTSLETF